MTFLRSSEGIQKGWTACFLILSFVLSANSSTAQDARFAYVADLFSNAISQYQVDPATGALTFQRVFSTVQPSSIVVTPSGTYAYVSNYFTNGTISGFKIDSTTGELMQVPGSPFANRTKAWRVTVSPSGRFLYAANVDANTVSAFSIDANSGALTSVPGSPFAVGTTPYHVAVSPSELFAYVANSASSNVSAFHVDPNTGALSEVQGSPFLIPGLSQDGSAPAGFGAGPAAVGVSPSGRFLYVANIYSYTVAVYRIDGSTGALTAVAGSPFPSPPEPGYFAFDASGDRVYVANGGTYPNRLNGSVSVYAVDSATGALAPIAGSPFAAGSATHSIALNGGFAYATSYYGNTIPAFGINASNGALSPIAGAPFATGSNPVEIAFVKGISCAIDNESAMSVSAVHPASGSNTGLVTISLRGCGLFGLPTVKLSGIGPDVTASNVHLTNGSNATATFDLTGIQPGVRNVVVTNPDGTSANRAVSFTVDPGGSPDIWIDIIGFDVIRVGRPQTFYVLFGNRGTQDRFDVPLFITVPASATVSIDARDPLGLSRPTWLPGVEIPTGAEKIIPVWLYSVPAESSGVIALSITSPGDTFIKVEATLAPLSRFAVTGSSVDGASHMDLLIDELAHRIVQAGLRDTAGAEVGSATLSLATATTDLCSEGDPDLLCEADTAARIRSYWSELIHFLNGVRTATPLQVLAAIAGGTMIVAGASISSIPLLAAGIGVVVLDGAVISWHFREVSQIAQKIIQERHLPGVGAVDPNDKIGPSGVGAQRYVMGRSQATPYAIYFENDRAASAPAQEVEITDSIDVAKFDRTTLNLGPIAFGTEMITPLPFSTSFSATVDLRPRRNLLVAVTANFDESNNVLRWHFRSIDPETGLPPTDPTSGFLPPSVGGSVLFTVMPKSGLATDVQIQNQAAIVFDTNPPVLTQVWTNTLDSAGPASHMLALPLVELAASFPVAWTGADVGAGIGDFMVYVSDNGCAFEPFQTDTGATSAMFSGQPGHTYSFYSIARDLVGNFEPAKTVAEATTTVAIDTTTPVTAASVSGPAGTNGWYRGPTTVALTSTDPGSGVAATYIGVDGGAITTYSVPIVIQTDGVHEVSFFSRDGAGNLETTKTLVVQIDATHPAVGVPMNQALPQTRPDGAIVTYRAPTIAETGSGEATSNCLPASGSVFPVGTTTVVCTATDFAGNSGSGTFTVTVTVAPAVAPDGRIYGEGSVEQGSKHGHFIFRVAQIRNLDFGRLEFWTSDSRFSADSDDDDHGLGFDGEHDSNYGRDHHGPPSRFEATSVSSVVFSDDPAFRPGHGRPSMDTVQFLGAGKWNSRSGYTFEAFATDRGEPGRRRDTFSLIVKDGRGKVVATVNGALSGGNIQSTRLRR